MDGNKVLYISQEITPYVPATPMSQRCRDLSQGILEKGNEVRTFMPKYGCIKERRNQLHEVIRLSGLNIEIDDADHPLIIKVATLQPTRMQVYFIDNEDYFLRTQSAKDLETRLSPEDNDERSIFFVRGVVETVKKLRWDPTFIHCSGWLTALAPLYLRNIYGDDPTFRNSKIVYSIFDESLESNLDPRMAEKLRLEGFTDDNLHGLASANPVTIDTLHKLAIDYSDGIVCESPDISPELIDYIKSSGKPYMPYTGEENFVQAYADFYDKL